MNNNQKATKRALLTSVMALVMCVVMLVGTTFAWFTDTASTGVNKIVAGNLDVELLMHNGEKYVNISEEREPIFGSGTSTVAQNKNLDTLWEPGKTQVAYLAIENKGNLALKYKVALNVTNPADGKDLYKVMQYAIVPNAKNDNGMVTGWTTGGNVTVGQQPVSGEVSLAVGATHYFALLVHMDEMAGNEYKNGKVDFDLTVYATQDTVENDSFNNQYDKDATYPIDNWDGTTADDADLAAATDEATKTVTVDSGKVLAALANKVNTGSSYDDYTIKLTKNLDLNGIEWTPIGTKGTSNVFKGTFDGDGATISNLKISGGSYVALFGETSGAAIKDLTVTGEVSGEDVAGIVAKATDTTITNCVSKVNVTATAGKAAGISASFGGTITKCENRGTVATAAAQPAGGLVAWCNAAVIENCHNYGAVTAGDHGALDSAQAGGLCGNLAAGSTIKNCSNSAVITSANLAGGVAGRAGAENKTAIVVEKFTNTGAIKGTYAAGIIADAKNVRIKESNVSGTITGSEIASGLFGRLRTGEITTSVVDATVTKSSENGYKGQYVGVIAGTVAMNLTGEARTDDIGCYADVTLTINGRIPNNNDFAGLDPQNFVHENQGHTKTIIIVAADGTTTYTYSIANGYKWAK